MVEFFRCPGCNLVHAEPAEAYYVLHVQCTDCELTLAVEAWEGVRRELPEAA